MDEKKYSPEQDYCATAKNFQAVPSHEEYLRQRPDTLDGKVDANRANTPYSCPDDYRMGSIQDNRIYIATTDGQHDQIAKGEHVSAQGGLSGYFSDQATIDACKNGESLDNTKYNEMCQIAPYRPGGLNGDGDASYKPHVDCFEIDRNALRENYGTDNFNAAVSKCEANNQFGSGGGNQGYNPHISEMIDNGSLKHVPEQSFSDRGISKSEHNNPNMLSNSAVAECDYTDMMRNAKTRAQDCVDHNTPHPSPEARQNGYPPNPSPIESNTGHATYSAEVNKAAQTSITDHPANAPPSGAKPAPRTGSDMSAEPVAGAKPTPRQADPVAQENASQSGVKPSQLTRTDDAANANRTPVGTIGSAEKSKDENADMRLKSGVPTNEVSGDAGAPTTSKSLGSNGIQ